MFRRVGFIVVLLIGIMPTQVLAVDPSRIKVWVSQPLILRGPENLVPDGAFGLLKLSNGTFRGFTANQTTYKIDGCCYWSMAGAKTAVFGPGPASWELNGRWIQPTLFPSNGKLYGLYHAEQWLPSGAVVKSMGLAYSTNEGLTWTKETVGGNGDGKILSTPYAPLSGNENGVGDCTAITPGDTFVYAYCQYRNPDENNVWKTVVARALIATPQPGNWYYYYKGSFDQTANNKGLNGTADNIGTPVNASMSYWTDKNAVLGVFNKDWLGDLSVRTEFSNDKINFVEGPALFVTDGAVWSPRTSASPESYFYFSVANTATGGNSWGNGSFGLYFMYVKAGQTLDPNRYHVHRTVWISEEPTVPLTRGHIALTRYRKPGTHIRYTTTGPVTETLTAGYNIERNNVGWILTEPPPVSYKKLITCKSTWPGHDDFVNFEYLATCPSGWSQVRTEGYIFATQQAGSKPIYRCYNATEHHHFVSDSATCEGLGTQEWLMGYVY